MEVNIVFEGVQMKVTGEYHPYEAATWGRNGGSPESTDWFEWETVEAGDTEITDLIGLFSTDAYNRFESDCFNAAIKKIQEAKEDRADWEYHHRIWDTYDQQLTAKVG